MNLMEYYRFTGEIRKNFWEFKNNLYNGLSNEDRLVDSIIVSRLDPPCSKPTHKLPDFRLDIDFSEFDIELFRESLKKYIIKNNLPKNISLIIE